MLFRSMLQLHMPIHLEHFCFKYSYTFKYFSTLAGNSEAAELAEDGFNIRWHCSSGDILGPRGLWEHDVLLQLPNLGQDNSKLGRKYCKTQKNYFFPLILQSSNIDSKGLSFPGYPPVLRPETMISTRDKKLKK